MTNEEIITDFLQKHYTDETLAALLAHAEDGKLAHCSCCCLVGIPTADHALQGVGKWSEPHYFKAAGMFGTGAGVAYNALAATDDGRRAKLIPLIKTEMARRESLRSESPEQVEVTV
jgi:hypothetical protein